MLIQLLLLLTVGFAVRHGAVLGRALDQLGHFGHGHAIDRRVVACHALDRGRWLFDSLWDSLSLGAGYLRSSHRRPVQANCAFADGRAHQAPRLAWD